MNENCYKDRTDTELRIKLATRHFYEELERRCKRFHPTHFVPRVVQIMRDYHNRGRYPYAPNFQVGMMIEANCAYHRGHASDMLTQSKYARVKNTFVNHEPPAMNELIERDFGSFFLVMHRQQIKLQKSYSKLDVSRYRRLFVHGEPLPTSGAEFAESYGLSPEEWIKAGFAMFAVGRSNSEGRVTTEHVDDRINLRMSAIERYCSEAAAGIANIGNRFKQLRENTRPEYHPCIRSAFLERPLVRIGEKSYVAPFPNLAFHYTATGLHERMLRIDGNFNKEFGGSIERYVKLLGSCMRGHRIIATEAELAERASRKSCDLLIEFDSYILLVESKAAIFSRDIITPATIAEDNSTRKIRKAIVQLYHTAYDLEQGRYDGLGISADKPVHGAVVTFGEVPFVNAPWYYDKYIWSSTENKLGPSVYPSRNMHDPPIVLSLEGFEQLVVVMSGKCETLPALRANKEEMGYAATGDWDTYLVNIADPEDEPSRHLPHLEADYEAFFTSLGLESEDSGENKDLAL